MTMTIFVSLAFIWLFYKAYKASDERDSFVTGASGILVLICVVSTCFVFLGQAKRISTEDYNKKLIHDTAFITSDTIYKNN